MNLIDRLLAPLAPGLALRRVQARRRLTAYYEAGAVTERTANRRAPGTDADAAAARRGRIAAVARDLIRNTPLAVRVQQVVTNNVVADGIVPRITLADAVSGAVPAAVAARMQRRGMAMIETVLDRTTVDADGRQNLYGLQRLVTNTIVDAGEALVLRVRPRAGVEAPVQLRVLEPDYLDTSLVGRASGARGWVHEGIEYADDGRRLAYWLFDRHPGSSAWGPGGASMASRRVPASEVLHVYRQDRPNQQRGVSWFAPIATALADLGDYADAELVRHKIAATFVGFRRLGDTIASAGDPRATELGELRPGLIQDIGPDEEMTFPELPDAGDFDPFSRAVLRQIAAGLGVTYEALTGDLSSVNFSSARMGRVEMDRNISAWQWLMLIPGFLQPIEAWLREGWARRHPDDAAFVKFLRFEWVPPHRVLVDPTREIPALKEAVRAGFTSRSAVVRSFGFDPERLEADIAAENARADRHGLQFSSDGRLPAGTPPAGAADEADETDEQADEADRNVGAAMPSRRSGGTIL
ncbi:MAG TPA: phage portal protein [Paracoccaceae bacterium]|nr:phage portal protein [Paracoccaceae bacterium]